MRRFFLACLLPSTASLVLLGACDVESHETQELSVCETFDACNYLDAGYAVADCTDDLTICTDALVGSAYEDWKASMDACLARSNCMNFYDCWESVPMCGVGAPATPGDTPQGGPVQFEFECDMGAFIAPLAVQVDPVEASGITWGTGPNPDITGVIGTGDFIYYTAGTFTWPDRVYRFEGENQFADFWSDIPGDRLTSEFQLHDGGMTLVWDWFGAATQHDCQLVGSSWQ